MPRRIWAGSVTYAFATAMHLRYEHAPQPEATTALTGTVTRRLGSRSLRHFGALGTVLGVWHEGVPEEDAPARVADALVERYRSLGMPTRVRDLGVPESYLPSIVADSSQNYNADPERKLMRERELLLEVLRDAW